MLSIFYAHPMAKAFIFVNKKGGFQPPFLLLIHNEEVFTIVFEFRD